MIRIQLYCGTCKQYVDVTFAAKKAPGVAEWFNGQHLYPDCMIEEDRDGQDEDGAEGGTASDEAATVDGAAPGPGGSKAH